MSQSKMTPEEFEGRVAEYYERLGYRVTRTPISNDFGIDVFAERGEEKIAVQAKMYGATGRKVNRAMMMELYGAMKYAQCTSAALVTNGRVLPDAVEVAKTLGITIVGLGEQDIASSDKLTVDKPTSRVKPVDEGHIGFDMIWREYVMPLAGTVVHTMTGKTNHIVAVDWGGLERQSSNGRSSRIPIEAFRYATDTLFRNGEITRDDINQRFPGRYSSGVYAVLSVIPLFTASAIGPAKLFLRERGQST